MQVEAIGNSEGYDRVVLERIDVVLVFLDLRLQVGLYVGIGGDVHAIQPELIAGLAAGELKIQRRRAYKRCAHFNRE